MKVELEKLLPYANPDDWKSKLEIDGVKLYAKYYLG